MTTVESLVNPMPLDEKLKLAPPAISPDRYDPVQSEEDELAQEALSHGTVNPHFVVRRRPLLDLTAA